MQTSTLHRFFLYVCAQFSVRIDKEKIWWKRAGSNRGPPACEAGTPTS